MPSDSGKIKVYLIGYNAISAIAWSTILGCILSVLCTEGAPSIPIGVDRFARITQTFAVVEVLHALTGVVPAPVGTTSMQVASRLLLVWGICWPFPQLNASLWYSCMMLAWSTTEVIRYTYFALRQADAGHPALHWLRYSAFLVLYPVGISSEVAMIIRALVGPAGRISSWYPLLLIAILASYVPGSVILYSHMMKQRKRYVGGGNKAAGAELKKVR